MLLNTKCHNTSENFYFEVILVQEPVSCEVTNRYMNFFLDSDEKFNSKAEGKTCMSWLQQEALLSIKNLLIAYLHTKL